MAYKQPCSPFKFVGDELTRKEKRAIKKSQRQNKSSKVTRSLNEAGIAGIGPSTPAIEVEGYTSKDIRPIGTGTGYNIEGKAIASVAPMPGTMGDGITLTPNPTTPSHNGKKKDLNVEKFETPKQRGWSKNRSKILKRNIFGRVGFKNR